MSLNPTFIRPMPTSLSVKGDNLADGRPLPLKSEGETLNSSKLNTEKEFPAAEVRVLLQQIFPTRQLVLSQFTFFNQIGVAKATGESIRRGRRCYRVVDLLSIATVLALKEQGIPLKNIDSVPPLIQERSAEIFQLGEGCRLSGFGDVVSLLMPGESHDYAALDAFLSSEDANLTFWSFDVGQLARKLEQAAAQMERGELGKIEKVIDVNLQAA